MSTPDLSNGQPGALNMSRESTREMREQEGAHSAREPPRTAGSMTGFSPGTQTPATAATGGSTPPTSNTLSGLVCNVHRTTGKEPHPLVGATTTILGDTLYVFGGRILSRTRPHLTSDLYALDLISRHWTRVDVKGEVPPPRYFHSVCALGDSKLVCYGGMSPSAQPSGGANLPAQQQQGGPDQQPEVGVMSDIHIYDVRTRTWAFVPTTDAPQGRYAHCATILGSSAVFSSATAPLSAIQHNPSTGNPNQGSIGVTLDGTGGAEMVVVGGQDCANHYIEQISVFNLRSLQWTVTSPLGKSCGAYRSVVSPLTGMPASRIGKGTTEDTSRKSEMSTSEPPENGSSMLIYSNYNFLDVKLELQVRLPDGTLSEKHMHGHFSPPGLRFPNGGVIDGHFVVSGTYLTSSKQEYALWALDLKTLTWSRIDAGGSVFSQGSWNRGLLWNRRNTFVILGNNKRSLVEDYNHRRINFSHLCMVELEAFGLYENPRRMMALSGYTSVSAPVENASAAQLPQQKGSMAGWTGGGRPILSAAEELGRAGMGMRELADMDFVALGGERLPVNSRIIARRWGPYFVQLLKDGAANQDTDTATLRPPLPQRGESQMSQASSTTITASVTNSSVSSGSTVTGHTAGSNSISSKPMGGHLPFPTPHGLPPMSRPRTLYLPHAHLTLQALIHYFYISALPSPNHSLCTPQILCSLLQLARPYQIDGLLEATVERLHQVLDGRNAASIFNAAAMAAGGGRGVGFAGGWGAPSQSTPGLDSLAATSSATSSTNSVDDAAAGKTKALRINTSVANNNRVHEDEVSSASTGGGGSSATGSSEYSGYSDTGEDNVRGRAAWTGEMSAVIGLQKRGLRGLLEGRKLRERGRSQGAVATHVGTGPITSTTAASTTAPTATMTTTTTTTTGTGTGSVGLGIA